MPDSNLSRRIFVGGALSLGALSAVPGLHSSSALFAASVSEQPEWLNPPQHWKLDGTSLTCTADPKTDFWRKTFYDYITDNGHFYYRRVKGDFTTEIKVTGQYHDLYDQAGVMVRIDASNWMKCGIELVDGNPHMSIVYTNDYSNWATSRLQDVPASLWLRVERKGPALHIFHLIDGSHWTESGVGYLGTAESVMVGPMCAAPEGNGFEVRFDHWSVKRGAPAAS